MAADTLRALERDGNGAVRPVQYRDGVRRPRWSGYTAFVLSGGGARGALQVGMLRALLERGETPDIIVGTSIGAWNGVWLARDPTVRGIAGLAKIWHKLTPSRVLLGREPYGSPNSRAISAMLMLSAIQHVTQGYASLYGDAGLHSLATELLQDGTFEDLRIPLYVVAANISRASREVFHTGPLAAPVLASSAIPGIFPPVHIGNSIYVDGGALDNASLDLAVTLGARRLFVLDVGYDIVNGNDLHWPGEPMAETGRARGNGPHPLAAVLERTAQVMSHYHLNRALEHLPPGIERHVLRPSPTEIGGTLDFGKADEWMEHAYERACAYLESALPALATTGAHRQGEVRLTIVPDRESA
jgi:NTE family protein